MNLKPFKDSEIKKAAVSLACFHGETWYKCPWCGKNFEHFDAVYERKGITKTGNGVYICDCGRKFTLF